MSRLRKTIPRVAPLAYEYVRQVLDFGFHNAHSVGMTGRLERQWAERFGQTFGIAHCNGTATLQSALLAEMRTYSARAWEAVVRGCSWLVPQKTPDGYVNAYWTYTVRITRDDIVWSDLLATFVALGGDGFYGCYQPAHLEPVFANLNAAVDEAADRYPHFAGRLPRYERGLCPVWERIQPRVLMLKTNYFDTDLADRQAEILAQTIRRFDQQIWHAASRDSTSGETTLWRCAFPRSYDLLAGRLGAAIRVCYTATAHEEQKEIPT
jgi:dTDP-4-amino-4,6-dideoxygalactose transaminase